MIGAYLKSDYWAEVEQFDIETGCKLRKIKIIKFPPDEMTDLVYEIIQLQRSVLDQTVYVAGVLSGLTGKDLECLNFPVSTEAAFDSCVDGRCKGLHPELKELFRSFQAHPAGNRSLFELNRIRRQGHHKFIEPVGTIADVEPGLASISDGYTGYIAAPVWDRKNHEIIFASEGKDGKFGYDAKATFHIAFGEVDAVGGKPVLEFLNGTHASVYEVLNSAILCTNRLGLTNIP